MNQLDRQWAREHLGVEQYSGSRMSGTRLNLIVIHLQIINSLFFPIVFPNVPKFFYNILNKF